MRKCGTKDDSTSAHRGERKVNEIYRQECGRFLMFAHMCARAMNLQTFFRTT